MKIKIFIFTILIISISCKKEKKTVDKSTIFKIENGRNCFKEIIENKIKKDTTEIIEINELIVNLTIDGNSVSGDFNYLPFKEKADKGKFTGILKDNVATTICVFNQNGKSKKEELIFKIETNKIAILGGEKEKIDGVWKFKDKSKGFYMSEIPRVSCN
ncbi:MAG: hypothetical protein L3J23_09820 [Flavobacteriaceae bacterium]|nr:hypothetical protein [Flavobacteriaceae bacterium]